MPRWKRCFGHELITLLMRGSDLAVMGELSIYA